MLYPSCEDQQCGPRSTNPCLTSHSARRQHATRPAAGKQRASPTRPDPPQPVPGPSVGFCIPSLFADQIIPFPQTPACCIHAPLSPPRPSPVSPRPPGGLTRTSERVRGTPIWDGAMGDRNPSRAACFEGCRRGGHRWRCKQPFQKQPTPTKQKGTICRRYGYTRSRAKTWPGNLSSLELGRRSRRSVEQRHDATKNDRHHLANAFIAS